MKTSPSKLQDHSGYWLRILSNQATASLTKRLEKFGVSVPNWIVLRILFDVQSLSLKEIVSMVGVDQGSLSRMMDRLLARGLILRNGNPDNRREVAISLTRTGRSLVPKLAREADENDRLFFSRLSDQARERFLQNIQALLT